MYIYIYVYIYIFLFLFAQIVVNTSTHRLLHHALKGSGELGNAPWAKSSDAMLNSP